MEGLHGVGDVDFAHPDACVVHPQSQVAAHDRSRDDHLSPFRGELDRVGQEVEHDLPQAPRIRNDHGQVVGE